MTAARNPLPAAIVHALRFPVPVAADFAPMTFATADSKAWFATHFLRFASADFPKHHFTQRFYRHVMNTFGFIAHYDLHGFWTEYFTSTGGKIEFLDQVIHWPCHGDATHTFCDAEREIARRIRRVDLVGLYRRIGNREQEAAERAAFLRLKAKFEPNNDVMPLAPTLLPPTSSRAHGRNRLNQADQLALAIE